MSKFLNADDKDDNDEAKATAISLVFLQKQPI